MSTQLSHEPARIPFQRSTFCGGNACVEVAYLSDDGVALRDSKNVDPNAPVLRFTAEEWDAFIEGVHHGEFTLDALSAYSPRR